MHNIAEYPSIIEEKADSQGNLYNKGYYLYDITMKNSIFHG